MGVRVIDAAACEHHWPVDVAVDDECLIGCGTSVVSVESEPRTAAESETGPTYTVPQLKQLLASSEKLGFTDDAAHWRALLAEHER